MKFLSLIWEEPERLIVLMLGGVLALLVFVFVNTERQSRAGFAAWVKLTGNPKALTYQEWKDLTAATRGSETSLIIIGGAK